MDYYKKAKRQIKMQKIEEAISTLIAGLDRGYVKCAYGLVHTLLHYTSYTFTEDEAIALFNLNYERIKLLAEEGDIEAMLMLADGIEYGLVPDEDEPYGYWRARAVKLGGREAVAQFDTLGDDALPDPDDGQATIQTCDADDESLPSDEQVLIAEPDLILREQCGITRYLLAVERSRELQKCSQDYDFLPHSVGNTKGRSDGDTE